MKDECLFCKIAKGEIPCHKIFENDDVIAFLDISNEGEGHTLLIPKKHCKNLLDCDEKTLSNLFLIAKKISNHYVENCNFDGVNLFVNNNESAGQSVFHLHLHIIPRKKDDNILPWKIEKTQCDLVKIKEKLELK